MHCGEWQQLVEAPPASAYRTIGTGRRSPTRLEWLEGLECGKVAGQSRRRSPSRADPTRYTSYVCSTCRAEVKGAIRHLPRLFILVDLTVVVVQAGTGYEKGPNPNRSSTTSETRTLRLGLSGGACDRPETKRSAGLPSSFSVHFGCCEWPTKSLHCDDTSSTPCDCLHC